MSDRRETDPPLVVVRCSVRISSREGTLYEPVTAAQFMEVARAKREGLKVARELHAKGIDITALTFSYDSRTGLVTWDRNADS